MRVCAVGEVSKRRRRQDTLLHLQFFKDFVENFFDETTR